MMTQTFEEYVSEWESLAKTIADNKDDMRAIVSKEMVMRKAIEASVKEAAGSHWREGVNKFPLPDGRTLKITHKVSRTIDPEQLEVVREQYQQLNDRTVEFDDLYRVKYEINKRELDKLSDNARLVLSRMLTNKPAAPDVDIT